MKKFFAFAGAVALLAACSSDDESSFDYDNLYKKWYQVSYKVEGNTIPYGDHEVCGKDYVEFNEDGTLIFVDVVGCDGGVESESQETIFVRNGNTITADPDGFNQQVKVIKLTATTLELRYQDDFDGDDDEETVTEVYTSNPN